jgi:hypothetical protein
MMSFPKTLPTKEIHKNFHKKNFKEFNTIVDSQNVCFCPRHGN